MKSRVLSILLCVVLLGTLAACSKAPASSSTPAPAPSISQPDPLYPAYFTGLEKSDHNETENRGVAVMIGQDKSARPTRGLSEAQIVIESQVEGEITRLLAIYEDYRTMPLVSPIRSARDQFFQIMNPSKSFFVHSGPGRSSPVYVMLDSINYQDLDFDSTRVGESGAGDAATNGKTMWRDQQRLNQGINRTYTLVTNGDHLANYVDENDVDDQVAHNGTFLGFAPYNEDPVQPAGGTAAQVYLKLTSIFQTQFDYDEATGRYLMSMNAHDSSTEMAPYIDMNNDTQVGFDNVLTLFAPMGRYAGLPLAQFNMEGGTGYYFNGGRYEQVRWEKGGLEEQLRIYSVTEKGEEYLINPGTTYISLVDTKYQAEFEQGVQQRDTQPAAASGSAPA